MIQTSQILKCYQIELVEKLEDLLSQFYDDMLDSGLKSTTAERHVANTELFLIEYHVFYFLDDINSLCPEKIYDFLGVWYFQKMHSPSENDLFGILSSLRKFLNYALQKGILEPSLCQQLRAVCNDKKYFLCRLRQYELNPNTCLLPHNSPLPPEKITLSVFSNRIPIQNIDDLFLDALIEEDTGFSLEEMLDRIMKRFQDYQPSGNVISLEPIHDPDKLFQEKLESEEGIKSTILSLKEHCLVLHRANLVFMRWLDRYDCRISELPSDAIAACLDCDKLLTCLLAKFSVELISPDEIKLGHRLLDMMDKMLWKARFQIARSLGLDLRNLPL